MVRRILRKLKFINGITNPDNAGMNWRYKELQRALSMNLKHPARVGGNTPERFQVFQDEQLIRKQLRGIELMLVDKANIEFLEDHREIASRAELLYFQTIDREERPTGLLTMLEQLKAIELAAAA